MPICVNILPLAIFHSRSPVAAGGARESLGESPKLAGANDTETTLLESVRVVSETSTGKLSEEFAPMYAKVNYGNSLRGAPEAQNKYHIPRLARTVKLISEAQETSSHIQQVLSTAATTSENRTTSTTSDAPGRECRLSSS